MRAEGFYWVVPRNTMDRTPTVARWDNIAGWDAIGCVEGLDDDHFQVISERLASPEVKRGPA